ncbi:DNA-binding transcriptional MerR regulator [Pseudomonas brassicacearum]|uniref:DNA-binding transcriptional MerR regulator n=1 Tax=Pseudomonas brassicacearum TaxID=930166 RepID=A0AAW8MI78_9PSED|nr:MULTISPECIES: MerR family transcriptional regulator [Pseudomonas]MDR6961861.1 DNA-binding transcriptional MerR regulator [Pseudomonas brassicacearum]UZE17051.1 MerR family transcriptional regulator [Pseudomonas sp. B21-054]
MNRDPDSSASEDLGADFAKAVAEGWLPIREVARQTGVNAVTLRAWERRYGLIVPHRTPKGHRLFNAEHVQRIQSILTWINRGMAVSKIKPLLDTPQPLAEPLEDDWQRQRHALVLAVRELAERQVDERINQAIALYPPRTVCEQLLLPLLAELQLRWQGQFGAQLERVFLYSWLRSKFGSRIYHNNRQLRGAPLLLVNHSDLPMEPHLWLTAWLSSSADCPVEVFDAPLPAGELALAVERLKARGVLLYSSNALNLSQLPKLLGGIDCPIIIAGPAASIHQAKLSTSVSMKNLTWAEDPLSAHRELSRRKLL